MSKVLFIISFFSLSCSATSFLHQAELGLAIVRSITGATAYGIDEMLDLQKKNNASVAHKAHVAAALVRLTHDGVACYNHQHRKSVLTYLIPLTIFDCWRAYKACVMPKKEKSTEIKDFSLVPGLLSIGKAITLIIETCVNLKLASLHMQKTLPIINNHENFLQTALDEKMTIFEETSNFYENLKETQKLDALKIQLEQIKKDGRKLQASL